MLCLWVNGQLNTATAQASSRNQEKTLSFRDLTNSDLVQLPCQLMGVQLLLYRAQSDRLRDRWEYAQRKSSQPLFHYIHPRTVPPEHVLVEIVVPFLALLCQSTFFSLDSD